MVSRFETLVVAPTHRQSHALARGCAGAVCGSKHARNLLARTPLAECARSLSSHHAHLRRKRGPCRARGCALRTFRSFWFILGRAAGLAGGDFERPRNSAVGAVSLAQVSPLWSVAYRTGCIAGRPVRYWFALFLCRLSGVVACLHILVTLARLVGD